MPSRSRGEGVCARATSNMGLIRDPAVSSVSIYGTLPSKTSQADWCPRGPASAARAAWAAGDPLPMNTSSHPPHLTRGSPRIEIASPGNQAVTSQEVSGTFLRGTSERGPIPSRTAWTWTWPPYQGCHGQRTSRELVLWVFGCATVHGGPHNGLDGRTPGMVYYGAPPPQRAARDAPSRVPLAPPGSLSRAVGPPRTCCGELERRK